MLKFEYCMNALHYCMWLQQKRFDEANGRIFDKFMALILRYLCSQKIRERYYTNLKNIQKAENKVKNDYKYGLNIGWANHWFGYEYSSYPCLISFVLTGLVYKYIHLRSSPIVMLLIIAIPIGICYIPAYKAVFLNDRYLKYFKEFQKEDDQWHKKWNRITILFRIGGVLSTILGIISAICIIKYL